MSRIQIPGKLARLRCFRTLGVQYLDPYCTANPSEQHTGLFVSRCMDYHLYNVQECPVHDEPEQYVDEKE